MKPKKGFTLVELLVVIAVIALLMSILMPALRKARDHAMRVICGNHTRQIVMALTIYGDNYANLLPNPDFKGMPRFNEQEMIYAGRMPWTPFMGYWPWDGEYNIINEIMKCMGTNIAEFKLDAGESDPIPPQKVFYCPANVQQKRFLNTNWSYNIYLDNGRPAGYRVLGFAFLWYANWNEMGKRPIRGGMTENDPADPTKRWVNRTDVHKASEVEVVVDTTMSERGGPSGTYNITEYPNGNFAQIFSGGNPGAYGSPDQTSHLINDKKAAGGNIGFVDGHVDWRNFKDMRNRINQGPMWWW